MKKDLFHYYEADLETVFNAYVSAVKKQFGKDCSVKPFHTISFGLNFSFKYNMNGGSCHVHFMPYNTGTAVGVRYSIAQLMGARYSAHDADMTKYVQKELNVIATNTRLDMEEFLSYANKITSAPTQETNNQVPETKTEPAKQNSISYLEEIKALKELLDIGAITQEEFDAKKKELLGL